MYANKVDQVVTSTLYPVICSVKDRRDLLQEAFLKSNRMGLLWAAPMGIGIALFAPDLVHFVLGSRWDDAIPVIQAFGLMAVVNQIGFNWTAFFRALGDTKPIAIGGGVMAVAVTALTVPLIFVWGIEGAAVGMFVSTVVLVAVRLGYLRRLFPLRPILANVLRGMAPAVIALGATGLLRLATWGGERTEVQAIGEVAIMAATVVAVTLFFERGLLHEFRGYLRRPSARVGQAA